MITTNNNTITVGNGKFNVSKPAPVQENQTYDVYNVENGILRCRKPGTNDYLRSKPMNLTLIKVNNELYMDKSTFEKAKDFGNLVQSVSQFTSIIHNNPNSEEGRDIEIGIKHGKELGEKAIIDVYTRGSENISKKSVTYTKQKPESTFSQIANFAKNLLSS